MDWTQCQYLVVIVNYRTAARTNACLDRLAAEIASVPEACVVVVDNDSQDGSFQAIRDYIAAQQWPWAVALSAPKNGGYAYGNNFAIRQALASDSPPQYIHLLNPDTEVRPGALSQLHQFMERTPEAGLCGGCFENPDGSLWRNAFRFPSILGEVNRGLQLGLVTRLLRNHATVREMDDSTEQVDWLPGASLLVRRQVFEDVGLMDEHYFLYYEETDFCLAAHRAGWQCWYVPASKVMHIAGDSTGVTSREGAPKPLPKFVFDSRRYYFVKNHSLLYAAGADACWIICFAAWRLRRCLQRKPDRDPPGLLRDSISHSVFVRGGQ
ncbi:glycosyltransferase family 2 protein [Halioxenophilus aromaticivorans]|uniref:Glycosyltransferase 2-like domain-containing protein n=2 Tax=Halioxenophilus aromaticivorans TaxID=1306992 RepID=A0AAV3U7V9_9ALTE